MLMMTKINAHFRKCEDCVLICDSCFRMLASYIDLIGKTSVDQVCSNHSDSVRKHFRCLHHRPGVPMKTTAIARIRQIRQSLFARFTGVQSSVDHAPDRERKSAAVRQLYRILNNNSNVWVPTQVVADRSTGVFARLRRGVSQRVSALTIRNPFSEESLERTKRAFAFSFIETSLEKRQLLTTDVSNPGGGTDYLITIDDTSLGENVNNLYRHQDY
jgi:hypothetical protein